MMLDEHYSRLLARTPTMPAAEQQALAERYVRSRDRRDAERLVLGNLRLVVKLARELGGGYRGDFMDLVQEGNAGLTQAVERFDPTRGSKLSSYAALWIRALHHALPDGHEPDGSPHVDAGGPPALLRSDAARDRRVVGCAGPPRARRRLGSRGDPAGDPPRRGRQPAGRPVRTTRIPGPRARGRRRLPDRRSTSAAARS